MFLVTNLDCNIRKIDCYEFVCVIHTQENDKNVMYCQVNIKNVVVNQIFSNTTQMHFVRKESS